MEVAQRNLKNVILDSLLQKMMIKAQFEPKTYKEAQNDESWIFAMQESLINFKEMKYEQLFLNPKIIL